MSDTIAASRIRLPRVLRARDPQAVETSQRQALQHKDFSAPLSDIRYTPRWHKAYHPTHAYCLCANWTCSTSSRFARAYAYFIFPE